MRRVAGAVALSAAASIWGGMYVASKYVLQFIPPLTLVVLRFLIALTVLGVALAVSGRWRVRPADLFALALSGFVGYTVSLGAQFTGTRLSSAHNGALITSASPAFIVLFAALLLRERITRMRLLAVALATAGVLLIVGRSGDEEGPNVLAGNLWLVAAAVSWALFTVLNKRLTQRYSSLAVTTYTAVFGTLFTYPLSRLEPPVDWGNLPPLVWAGVLYIGLISTALAFYLWTLGFELLDAGSGSVFFFFQPVVGALLGWLLLGERLTAAFFAGAALIAAGVTLATREPAPAAQGPQISPVTRLTGAPSRDKVCTK